MEGGSPTFHPYWAYGSNMSMQRLVERVGPVLQIKGSVTLHGYELSFSLGRPDDGKANVLPAEDAAAEVEGVLYMLTNSQLEVLDTYEHVPTHYLRTTVPIHVTRQHHTHTITAITYIVAPHQLKTGLRPSPLYVAHLINGGVENSLSTRFWASLLRAASYEAYYVAYGRDMIPGIIDEEKAAQLVPVGTVRLDGWHTKLHLLAGLVIEPLNGHHIRQRPDGKTAATDVSESEAGAKGERVAAGALAAMEHVEGVVYVVTEAQLQALDKLHGDTHVRRTLTGTSSAILQSSGVHLPSVMLHTFAGPSHDQRHNGGQHTCTHLHAHSEQPTRRALQHLGQAIYGAKKAGLSPSYVRHLESLAPPVTNAVSKGAAADGSALAPWSRDGMSLRGGRNGVAAGDDCGPSTDVDARAYRVFVYGTLLSGLSNHQLLQVAGAVFVGSGRTVQRFRMYVKGVPFVTTRGVCSLGGKGGEGGGQSVGDGGGCVRDDDNGDGGDNGGVCIRGEVYEVDRGTFRRLDELEGCPLWYYRVQVDVLFDDDNANGVNKTFVCRAEMYVNDGMEGGVEVRDGDYRRFVRAKEDAALQQGMRVSTENLEAIENVAYKLEHRTAGL